MGFSKRRSAIGTGASCIGGWLTPTTSVTLLLLGCASVTVLAQEVHGEDPAGPQSAQQQCTSSSGASSCTCQAPVPPQPGQADLKELTATLSEESPTMDLTCVGANNSGAPATLVGGHVCPGNGDVQTCLTTAAASGAGSKVTSNGATVTLDSLLAQDATGVKWNEESTTGGDQKKYSLNIPKAAFPLLDKQFFVGCKDNTPNTPVCKVSVAVKARKSTTVGEAVTCAYGSASNVKRQSVTLTPSNNTLTITCGGGGKMVPDDYLTKFCAYGEDPGSCTSQAFTGLLPGFDQSWWVTKVNPAKLTIPADKFPTDEQKFTLGCKYTAADSSGKTHEARSKPASPETSICSVDVIITKQPSTTTTTSSTSSVSSSVFVAGTSVNAMVALVSLGALQAVSSLA